MPVFKTIKKNWGPIICSLVPLSIWHRLLGAHLILPFYHLVSDTELDHVSGLYSFRNLSQFEADMDFFLAHYSPVKLDDLIRYLDGVDVLPNKGFFLSFDDGFRQIYEVVAPVLRAKGIPAVFFLTTDTIDNQQLCDPQKKSLIIRAVSRAKDSSMTREISRRLREEGLTDANVYSNVRSITYRQRHLLDELGLIAGLDFQAYLSSTQPYLTSAQVHRLIEEGFDIGAHSVDHAPFSELTLKEQLLQTRKSADLLSAQFHYKCQAFAFPYRDWGVSIDFFQAAFDDGLLKVSFGTDGMHRHFFPRNLNRYLMDDSGRDARQLLAREFWVTLTRRSSSAYER